jgi:hypothetical protein
MRIAVSGTHCVGKSTLIEAFCLAHPQIAYEPEPYVVMQELYGEEFFEDPSLDDFRRQLEFNLETLHRYSAGDQVIFERSPVDFLAYMLALSDGDRSTSRGVVIEQSIDLVRGAVELLDAIVFLPLDGARQILVPEAENLRLRQAVDDHLNEILLADEFDLFPGPTPLIIEARGRFEKKLAILEKILA